MEANQSNEPVTFNHHDKTIDSVQDLIDFLNETVARHSGYSRQELFTEEHSLYRRITHAKIIDDNIIFELSQPDNPFEHEDE